MEGNINVPELIWKWVTYTPKFTDDAAKLSYLGLLGVLKATTLDMKLASYRVKKGGVYSDSDETILLQTKLVQAFAEFLEFTVAPAPSKSDAFDDGMDDYGGDYGDYGDEDYGKEDAFGAALNAAQFGDFDVGAFGNEQDAPGQNTTEDETTVEE